MTEKSPSKMQLSLALSFGDLAAGGVCWVESWCWHVLSLLEKSRLSLILPSNKASSFNVDGQQALRLKADFVL